jgi:hypothetical protein
MVAANVSLSTGTLPLILQGIFVVKKYINYLLYVGNPVSFGKDKFIYKGISI